MDKPCVFKDCTKPGDPRRKGYCEGHNKQRYRHGVENLKPLVKQPNRGCKVTGCIGRHMAKGYCNIHYKRWRYHNLKTGRIKAARVCTYPKCNLPHAAKGYCKSHYAQLQRGEPVRAIRQSSQGCEFPGCIRPHHGWGYCAAHLKQKQRGDTLRPLRKKNPIPVADRVCKFEGCPGTYHAKGYCGGHYRQVIEGKPLTPLITYFRNAGEVPCLKPECETMSYCKGLCKKHYFQRRWNIYTERRKRGLKPKPRRGTSYLVDEMAAAARKRPATPFVRVNLKKTKTKTLPKNPKTAPLIQPSLQGDDRNIPNVGIYGMEGAPFKSCSHMPEAWAACRLTAEEAAWVSGLSTDQVQSVVSEKGLTLMDVTPAPYNFGRPPSLNRTVKNGEPWITCRTCRHEGPVADFRVSKGNVDGVSTLCRECAAEYDRQRNRERTKRRRAARLQPVQEMT